MTIIIRTNSQLCEQIAIHCSLYGNTCNLNHLDVSQCDSFAYAFSGPNKHFNGDISSWRIPANADFTGMFQNSAFEGDISHWRINVNNARDMFTHARNMSFLRWPDVYDGNHAIRSLEVYMGLTYQRVGHGIVQGLNAWTANHWQYIAVNDAVFDTDVLAYVSCEYREFYNTQRPILKELNIPVHQWGDMLAQTWNAQKIPSLTHQDLVDIV